MRNLKILKNHWLL